MPWISVAIPLWTGSPKKILTIVKYSGCAKRRRKQIRALVKNYETLYRAGFRIIAFFMISIQDIHSALYSSSVILIILAFLCYNLISESPNRTINFQIIVKSRQDKRTAPSSFHLFWISFLQISNYKNDPII